MIGKEIGKNSGGVLNTEDGACPEDLSTKWKYWNDFRQVSFIIFQMGAQQEKESKT